MKLYKILIFALCFTLFSFTSTTVKHEKTKTIHKKYSVDEKANLFVNNKYGNINITTWNENSIEITVKITVKGNDIDKVEDKLNAIHINFEASKDLVEARTTIEKTNSNWSWWGNSNKVNYKINYFIKIPKSNNIDLYNKYGDINLDELAGKTNIKCNYGNIYADKLLNKTNLIELNYCGNSEIDYIKSANIDADYSKITINESENIKSNTDYTSVKIGTVNNLSFNSDYGNINVSEADNVTGNSDYTGMKFGTIHKNIDINTNYGSVKINNLAKGFEKVTIDSDYSSIKIGTPSNNNFSFNLNLNYAGFNYPKEKVDIHKSIQKTTKKNYEGAFGYQNTTSTINIKSNYGGVSFNIND